jgi:predicted RNA-binding Zn-ribbon protein involved in translation (DUF1610 family)
MTTLEEMIPDYPVHRITPKCCRCGGELTLEDNLGNGVMLYTCPLCDYPPPEDDHNLFCVSSQLETRVYKNHCWNCGAAIDSTFATPSRTPGMGYYCPRCGEDLTKWKLMKGGVV